MTPLQKLLVSDGAFATPVHILEALSAEQVKVRPPGAPHTLYEELWHMDFWQRLMLSVIHSESAAYPEHAAEGWPKDNESLTDETWNDLIARFLARLNEAAKIAGSPEVENEGVRDELESLVAHNAYHFGRMVFLRQVMGLWPPPSGGDTW